MAEENNARESEEEPEENEDQEENHDDDDEESEPQNNRMQTMMINNEPQQSLDTNEIHSDEEYYSDGSMRENEDEDMDAFNANDAGHKRVGSFQQKRESVHKEKEEMERKLRQLSQNLDNDIGSALDEFAEMEQMNHDKHVFSELFDKIDPDDNGDVDEKEWMSGLKRLKVNITESDMSKLFHLMDGDKGGYIDRQDWVQFCMSTYQSPELQRIHDSVLMSVKGHNRKPSNMFNPNEMENWSSAAVTTLEKQMTQALLVQGTAQLEVQKKEEKYFESMEKEANQNPDWCKPERALQWTPKEVAFWLDTIELSQYARKFDEDQLDGSILLNDVDRGLLQNEMNIKPLHVGKILREVDKLRKVNKDDLQEAYMDWNELFAANKHLVSQLQETEQQINELKAENAELKLKSISSVNLQNLANPAGDDHLLPMNGTTYTSTGRGGGGDMDLMLEEYKTDLDPVIEIKVLKEEINHLHHQKIKFAENAADEMAKLNTIIKALSNGYTSLSTPYYKKFNPVDAIIRSLGYEPHPNSKK